MARGKTNHSKYNVWNYRSTYTEERVKELTVSLRKWILESIDTGERFLFKRWAFENHVNPARISYIAELDDEFEQAYQVAKEWQEFKLEEDTLYKKTEFRMALCMLQNHHGWKTGDDSSLKQLGNEFGQYLNQQKSDYDQQKNSKTQDDSASSNPIN